MNHLHTISFCDKKFAVYVNASTAPEWLLSSFELEHRLRQEWWTIKPWDVVVDVGAAYGSYTLTALAQGAELVIAYEPVAEGLFDLCTNLALNNWSSRVIVLPFLAGRQEGEAHNFYPDSHSALPKGFPSSRLVLPVDKACSGLDRVDWIKVDVEGAEVEVLMGARETIIKHKPTIIVEYHPAFVPGVDEMVREEMARHGGYTEAIGTGRSDKEVWGRWQYEGR